MADQSIPIMRTYPVPKAIQTVLKFIVFVMYTSCLLNNKILIMTPDVAKAKIKVT